MNEQSIQVSNKEPPRERQQKSLEPVIAFLHAYDLAEDFLDSIGVSLETFCSEMTGGWLFGYIEALKTVGVRSVLYCISAQVQSVSRVTHAPTGATICILPAPRVYRLYRQLRTTRRRTLSLEGEFSTSSVLESRPRSRFSLLKHSISTLATYTATPLRLLAIELKNDGCQAILCQEYEYGRFDTCVLLGKLLKTPVFATFQGRTSVQRGITDFWVRPLTVKACGGLIISSQAEIKRVEADYAVPNSQIARVFSPVDVSSWGVPDRAKIRSELGLSQVAKVVICHGRIEIHKKGLDILLNAWQLICNARLGQDLCLLLIGTGSDAEAFQQQLASMSLTNVIWRNEYIQDRTLLRQYLAAADVYALSSRWEGFPVAPIEAMACGLPIVAADTQGISDILEHGEDSGGFVVPREDSNALAEAVGRILDNPTLAQTLSTRAAHHAKTHFSLAAIGQQLKNVMLR